MLDEESVLNGTEEKWVSKMDKNLMSNKHYSKPSKFSKNFLIKHYAGDVEYTPNDFIEKNKDAVNENVKKILSKSKFEVIMKFFKEDKKAADEEEKEDVDAMRGRKTFGKALQVPSSRPSVGKFNPRHSTRLGAQDQVGLSPRQGRGSGPINSRTSQIGGDSLSSQFIEQLNSLIQTLQESSPRYIRCIKPNSNFSPDELNSHDVCK